MQATRTPSRRRCISRLLPILAMSLSMTACFDDDPAGSASTGVVPTQSTGATASNAAPQVSGTPASEIPAGFPYVFKPTVVDPEGDAVTLASYGLPNWATFQPGTGEIRGVPTESDVGNVGGIMITASDGKATTTFGPFSVRVKSPAASGSQIGARMPTLGGSPPPTVVAGTGYTFQAIATDPDGDKLTFGARNLPAWLGINTANGLLTGMPAAGQVGTYSNITLSVTDGNNTASMPAFTITVTAPLVGPATPATTPTAVGSTTTAVNAAATGTATLTWLKPTQNTDGSALQDLAGFVVKYGNSPTSLTQRVSVADPSLTRYTVQSLGKGTWYFTVVSYTGAGLESDVAPLVSKTIS